jgi:hypothetical protein
MVELHEVPLNRIQQTLISRLSRQEQIAMSGKVGKVSVETWIDNETGDNIMKFVHSLYGVEVDRVIIPAVKIQKGFVRRTVEKIISSLLPFVKFLTEKVIREESEIALNQFFPKLVVPNGDTSQTLYLAVAQVTPDGQRAVGHTAIDGEKFITSTRSHSRKKATLHIDLKEEPRKPYWKK